MGEGEEKREWERKESERELSTGIEESMEERRKEKQRGLL